MRRNDVIQGLLYGSVIGALVFGWYGHLALGLFLGALAGIVPAWRQVLELTSNPRAWDLAAVLGRIGFYVGLALGWLLCLCSLQGSNALMAGFFGGILFGITLGGVLFSLGALLTFVIWLVSHLNGKASKR